MSDLCENTEGETVFSEFNIIYYSLNETIISKNEFDSIVNKEIIRVLTFDPNNGNFDVMLITDELKSYYNILNCSYIEKVTIDDLVNFDFDVIMDEEGKLKNEVIPSYTFRNSDYFCGKLMFTRLDSEGYWIGLTYKEIGLLKRKWNVIPYVNTTNNKTCFFLVEVSWR